MKLLLQWSLRFFSLWSVPVVAYLWMARTRLKGLMHKSQSRTPTLSGPPGGRVACALAVSVSIFWAYEGIVFLKGRC
jgi:hypothetical protein